VLQDHYCVSGLQHQALYNDIMSIRADQQDKVWVVPSPWRDGRRRWRAPHGRPAFVAVALLGAGLLATACGPGLSSQAVANLGKTTTTGPSVAPKPSVAGPAGHALAFVKCMRSHGDATIPDPVVSGHNVNISVDPNAPHFTRAYDACRHLLPNKGVPRNTITPAEQADYLKAAACMRAHGVHNFPDPVFKAGSVGFQSRATIDTSSPLYTNALGICQKLIPKGLPYSSTSAS
jgi:hypothetical protein